MADVRRWDVVVGAHVVGAVPHRVFEVPAREVVTGAVTAEEACRQVLGWAHLDAGAPIWGPYLRVGLRHVRAVAHIDTKEEEIRFRKR